MGSNTATTLDVHHHSFVPDACLISLDRWRLSTEFHVAVI